VTPDPFNPALYTLVSRPLDRPLVSSLKKTAEDAPSCKELKRVRLVDPVETAAAEKSSESRQQQQQHKNRSPTSASKAGSGPWVPSRASSLRRRHLVAGVSAERAASKLAKAKDVLETLVVDFPREKMVKVEDDGWADASPSSSPASLTPGGIRISPSRFGTSPEVVSYFQLAPSRDASSNTNCSPNSDRMMLPSPGSPQVVFVHQTSQSRGTEEDPSPQGFTVARFSVPASSVADAEGRQPLGVIFHQQQQQLGNTPRSRHSSTSSSSSPTSKLHHSPRRRAVGAE
jgi:hypothetical protein